VTLTVSIWTLTAALLSGMVIGMGLAQATASRPDRMSRMLGRVFVACGVVLLLGCREVMMYRPRH